MITRGNYIYGTTGVTISTQQIAERVSRLAMHLEEEWRPQARVTLVPILTGGLWFFSDLSRQLPSNWLIQPVIVSSYGDRETRKTVRIQWPTGYSADAMLHVADSVCIVVDDIVDTGHTLQVVGMELANLGALTVHACVLLDKHQRHAPSVKAHPNYVGFEIDDFWAVGYGMDYAGLYRNLPYVCSKDVLSAH